MHLTLTDVDKNELHDFEIECVFEYRCEQYGSDARSSATALKSSTSADGAGLARSEKYAGMAYDPRGASEPTER
jgi:hypothetical protein